MLMSSRQVNLFINTRQTSSLTHTYTRALPFYHEHMPSHFFLSSLHLFQAENSIFNDLNFMTPPLSLVPRINISHVAFQSHRRDSIGHSVGPSVGHLLLLLTARSVYRSVRRSVGHAVDIFAKKLFERHHCPCPPLRN